MTTPQQDRDQYRLDTADRWVYSIILIMVGVMILVNLPPDNARWFMLVAGGGIGIGVGMCLHLLFGGRR